MGNPDEDALKALRDGFESKDESYKKLCYSIVRDYIFDRKLEIQELNIRLESKEKQLEMKEEVIKELKESFNLRSIVIKDE